MSALTDLFTAMANKIRSKTGTQTTYTPSEMVSDGIDDVYDAGVASVPTPTSITPSNSSPVALTANTAVNPTASGVAIAAYADIQPSNSNPPVLVMPADPSTPPYICRIVGNSGYAITSYSSITPSNSSPVSLSSDRFYKTGGSGYAISSYSSKTPSDTSPASVSSGAIIKASAAGYLHKTAQGYNDYPMKANVSASSTSVTLTGLTSGKYYLLLVWHWGNNVSYSDTRFDSTTASGATLTKITNLRSSGGSNVRVAGTFFLMKTSATSVTLSNTNVMLAMAFIAEG